MSRKPIKKSRSRASMWKVEPLTQAHREPGLAEVVALLAAAYNRIGQLEARITELQGQS